MVDDLAIADAPVFRAGFRLADTGFVALLLLIFVGLAPFAARDAATMIGGADAPASGAGDTLRQLAFASVFALIVFASLRQQGMQAVAAVPPMLALLLVWCLLSAWWSAEPAVTFRRAMLASVVVLSAMMSFDALGTERGFRLWRYALGGILLVNWCSIAFVHQAVHLAGDPEPQLVGDWRGLYFHKNIAGAISAITAIVFFFSCWDRRRWIDAILCAGAIGFAVMTRSKSSLFILPLALAAGAIYRLTWHRAIDRWIVSIAFALAVLGAAAFVVMDQSAIVHALGDPEEFTGRTEIWKAELAYIGDHPYLGAGFGSFADTGDLSPLHDYVASNWVDAVAHGHNAYLQLCVTIGGIGLVLALIALVLIPLIRFCRLDGPRVAELAMPFALFVFLVLHNFLESDFLEGDAPAWVAFLFVLAALRMSRQTTDEWAAP